MDTESRKTTACILGYGFAYSLPEVLLWMAAEDIVSGTLIQSSFALMLFSCGDMIFRVPATLMFRKMSFLPLVVVLSIVDILAYLLLVAVDEVQLRLAAAFFVGATIGLSNVVIMFLIAKFKKTDESSSAFQVGTNAITLVFGLFYTGSTIWFCFSPRYTVAIFYPFAALLFVFYGILNHGPLKKLQNKEHTEHRYIRVSNDEKNNSKQKNAFWLEQVQFVYDVFPFFAYSFIDYFSFYLAVSAVLTAITMPSSPFRIRDHYHYYRLSCDIGMVLGGSEVIAVSCLCPGWLNVFRIRRLWLLVLVNVGHLMFFLFAAWYHFVPNVYILLVLSGTYGFVFGSTAVNVLAAAADKFESPHKKGLALNISQLGCALGRLASGLIGIFVETYLREHCTNNLLMGQYCLARFSNSIGWNNNFQCH